MHVQLRGHIVVYARDRRRVQWRLCAIGARGLEAGGEQHRQVVPCDRLNIERQCIQPVEGGGQSGIFCRRLRDSTTFSGRGGRQQVILASRHVHGCARIGLRRGHERHGRLGERLIVFHARDDPSDKRGHRGCRHGLVGQADCVRSFHNHFNFYVYEIEPSGGSHSAPH